MSKHSTDDESHGSENLHDSENPRKRPRTENTPRKSWSLMDKRPDYEVLQEMGVGVLDTEDNMEVTPYNTAPRSGAKRKHGIENKNPNVSEKSRSPHKHSPKAGSSKRSPETSLGLYSGTTKEMQQRRALDEETPLAQSIALSSVPAPPTRPLVEPVIRRFCLIPEPEPSGPDSFSSLSDEMMLSIFRWLPKRSLAHCMRVCKRWQQVACDETLWQRLDLGNKKLNNDALGKVLARKPSVLRLAASEIGSWHPSALAPSRLQYLDLSMVTIDTPTLEALLERCPLLKKLSVESVPLSDTCCNLIGKCSNLETLNLVMAMNITATGLESILDGCPNIQALNIAWCNLDEAALEILVSKLPSRIQRLGAGGARLMTDDMIKTLVSRCPRLLELDVSDCSRLTESSMAAIRELSRLEHLAISRCYLLPSALPSLSSLPSLRCIEVWGMLPAASLAALRTALPAIQLNQFRFSAIARPTVGTRRTSIWGLRTRD